MPGSSVVCGLSEDQIGCLLYDSQLVIRHSDQGVSRTGWMHPPIVS
jgi:hypothetical protein